MDKKQLRNTLMLMACAFIWGTAFVAQSVGSDYMGPYTFLASRSWLACAFLLGLMAVLRKMGKTSYCQGDGVYCATSLWNRARLAHVTTSTRREHWYLLDQEQ